LYTADFVNTAYPDDYEGSPLRPEDLEKLEAAKEETAEEKKVGTSLIFLYMIKRILTM
jgi:hypothetical protein